MKGWGAKERKEEVGKRRVCKTENCASTIRKRQKNIDTNRETSKERRRECARQGKIDS